jgi:hypothetical protein
MFLDGVSEFAAWSSRRWRSPRPRIALAARPLLIDPAIIQQCPSI